MKKVLFAVFVVMAFMALGAIAAMACDADKASTTGAKTASSCCAGKASTANASATNATMASSKTTTVTKGAMCDPAHKEACMGMMGATASANATCSPENMAACMKECIAKHDEICGKDHKCQLMAMSIKGMTCSGCESTVRTALMAVEGVNKVIAVCYQAGFAVVCTTDPNFKSETLTKAVSAKGYESQIIPAVSITTTETTKAECPMHPKKTGTN